MQLEEAKERFIQAWGTLGSSWGISRTMAQVHALLLISPDVLSADEIMEQLSISRGNANLTIRALIDWGLVQKEFRAGERKEYFFAEKDIWKVLRQVAKERRKRELEPMLLAIEALRQVEAPRNDRHAKAFNETVEGIYKLGTKADKTLEAMIKADESWFLGTLMKLVR